MRVLFLDMDGVLNSAAFARRQADCLRWEANVDAEAVARLNRIIAETGAKVVVSSTWRKMLDPQEMQRILDMHGFKGDVIGATPDFSRLHWYGAGLGNHYERGNEIQAWIDAHRGEVVEAFVILDDDSDMAHLHHRHVQCDWQVGLIDAGVEQAIALLTEVTP